MHPFDLVVLGVYLAAVVAFGARFSRRQRNIHDYFLTDSRVPWWALLGSIVATETSTVTLISVPGYAFGGDLTFLQLALGYVVGKIMVVDGLPVALGPVRLRARTCDRLDLPGNSFAV